MAAQRDRHLSAGALGTAANHAGRPGKQREITEEGKAKCLK